MLSGAILKLHQVGGILSNITNILVFYLFKKIFFMFFFAVWKLLNLIRPHLFYFLKYLFIPGYAVFFKNFILFLNFTILY